MALVGIHHVSFAVTNIEKIVDFCTNTLGGELRSLTNNVYDTLGEALFGTKWGVEQEHADLMIAVLSIAGHRVEFIEYRDPRAQPFHGNPSIAGAGHIAFRVDDIEAERRRLEARGVQFHSPINTFFEKGSDRMWKWCYFRGPDNLIFEIVEHSDT